MKNNINTLIILLAINTSCGNYCSSYSGEGCDGRDIGTTMKVNDKTYIYKEESSFSRITELNDTTLYVETGIGRGDNSQTILAYTFRLYLNKGKNDSLTIDFVNTTATFIEYDKRDFNVKFIVGAVTTSEYIEPLCALQYKSQTKSPDRLNIKLTGKVSYQNEERSVELNINYETKKVKYCSK